MSFEGNLLTVDGDADGERSVEALAEAVIAAERELDRARPERVVLADDSDRALAMALAASKLALPLAATPAAREAQSANARLIAQLAPDLDSAR